MAIDKRYGRVTFEHGTVDADEPVFVLLGAEELTPDALILYRSLCESFGSPPTYLETITEAIETVEEWQKTHETNIPGSTS